MSRDIEGPWSNQDTDRSGAGDHCHHIEKQDGTELVSVRVDRSVVVGVESWQAEPSDECDGPYRKPEVKWDQGLD